MLYFVHALNPLDRLLATLHNLLETLQFSTSLTTLPPTNSYYRDTGMTAALNGPEGTKPDRKSVG